VVGGWKVVVGKLRGVRGVGIRSGTGHLQSTMDSYVETNELGIIPID
jgi:hypothetical protein